MHEYPTAVSLNRARRPTQARRAGCGAWLGGRLAALSLQISPYIARLIAVSMDSTV